MVHDDIPFDRSLGAKPNEVVQLSPRVRRLICGNGGPFTLTGTCSYILGQDDAIVIDPGPVDRTHCDALVRSLNGARVKAILVTHTHRDHSPGAVALAAAVNAPIIGPAPVGNNRALSSAQVQALDASHDRHYRPDRILTDGETIEGPGYVLTAVATPGHTSNHMAYALAEETALFSGDHVMAWSTTVVAPPDGSMSAYMESLAKLQARPERIYWPGHGGPVNDPPRFVAALIRHRRHREQAILRLLKENCQTPDTIVKAVYAGLAPVLRAAAALSVLAHLEDLEQRGIVRQADPSRHVAEYCLVDQPHFSSS